MRKCKWVYGLDPDGQGFYWPTMKAKRKEYFHAKFMEPAIAQAVYQCDPTARESAVFVGEDFATYYNAPPDLYLGVQSPAVKELVSRGAMVIQAWDTAFSATEDSDHSSCFTALLVPSDVWHNGEDALQIGPCDPHYLVWILDVIYEKYTFAQVTQAIREQYLKWQPRTVVIENKAYAVTAIETLARSGIPFEPIMPETNKRARAVDGVGAGSVQGWFRNKRVWMPNIDLPWVEPFVQQMKDFSGKPGGKDDMVDACVHAIRFAIQIGTGAMMPSGWNTVEDVQKSLGVIDVNTSDPLAAWEQLLLMSIEDPSARTCSNCVFYEAAQNFCKKNNAKYIALDSCINFVKIGDPIPSFVASDLSTFQLRNSGGIVDALFPSGLANVASGF